MTKIKATEYVAEDCHMLQHQKSKGQGHWLDLYNLPGGLHIVTPISADIVFKPPVSL